MRETVPKRGSVHRKSEGLSGRVLRKLPFLAHALYVQVSPLWPPLPLSALCPPPLLYAPHCHCVPPTATLWRGLASRGVAPNTVTDLTHLHA